MIKFFRNIRLKELRDGKVGKPALPVGRYFLYAIGEIALVMIGILLALTAKTCKEYEIESIRIALKGQYHQHGAKPYDCKTKKIKALKGRKQFMNKPLPFQGNDNYDII